MPKTQIDFKISKTLFSNVSERFIKFGHDFDEKS